MITDKEFRDIVDKAFPVANNRIAEDSVGFTSSVIKSNYEEEAAKKVAANAISNAWRRYRFHKALSAIPYETNIALHTDVTDATLSEHMFGITNAPYNKRGELSYPPENPHISQVITSQIGYYRTDPLHALGDLREIIKSYESNPDYSQYAYIPVTLSKSISIESIIQDYASEYQGSFNVLRHSSEPNNPMAFIRVLKSETRFFLLKKVLTTLGFYPGSFESKVAGLSIKASHWQVALHQSVTEKEKRRVSGLDEKESYQRLLAS